MALTQVSTGGIKDGQVQTADLADGQVTVGKLHADALDHTYTLGASGTDHYTFTGEGLTGAVNDPTLYLTRGKTYRFVNGNSAGAHPFRIQTTVNGSAGTEYNTGVTNNGGAGGSTIVFEVPHDAPDVLYYQCTSHGSMGGILYVTGALADGTVTTAKLADQAVTLAKLPHGTSSNDGKFLRANNGADPTFETVSIPAGTTINNNADNRVITGSDTANTLEGETNFTIDSNGDVLIGTASWAYKKPLNVQGSSGAILALSNYDTTSYAADSSTSIELRLNTGNTGNQNGSCEIRAFKENGTNGDNARCLSFYTASNGGSPAERLRIQSGGGISFNGDTAAANALDDYEEGTWTPSNATVGFTTTQGYYLKIGNWVWWNLRVAFQSNSSGVYSYVDGFPFTTISQSNSGYQFGGYATYSTRAVWYVLMGNNASRIYMFDSYGNQLNHADFSGRDLRMQGWSKVQ